MSNILDIEMDQGSSLTYTFTLKDENQASFNLTGYDARLQIRKSYGATSALVNATLANGKLALTDAVGGVLTLSLAPSDTSSIRFNDVDDATLECVYDLEIQSPASKVDKPARRRTRSLLGMPMSQTSSTFVRIGTSGKSSMVCATSDQRASCFR